MQDELPKVYHLTHHTKMEWVVDFLKRWLKKSKSVYLQVISEQKAKSIAQNNTFHGLLDMWWKSGMSSYDDYDTMRKHYKLRVGLVDQYLYVDGEEIKSAGKKTDIPAHIPKSSCRVIPGSWSKATRSQGIEAIDLVISDMLDSGYSSKKFDEMLEEFNNRWW